MLLCHPEVAEPQPNRSMQDLNCHPELDSGSIHRGDEGSPLTPTLSRRARGRCAAFTLAEVLITLVIIGVVAAMTIPTLISNYKKQVVETRLAKFYSSMNQAMQLSSVDNGPISTWDYFVETPIYDEDNNLVGYNSDGTLAWFNKYIAPYMKTLKVEEDTRGSITVYFVDGSLATFSASSTAFYPYATDYNDRASDVKYTGKKRFLFLFDSFDPAVAGNYFSYHKGKGMEPYMGGWNGTREQLFTSSNVGCNENATNERAYCTKLIQLNNWKIPDDYPFEF